MAGTNVPRRCDAEMLARLLDSPEVARLVAELEATRWTGRPGYPIRAMVGMALLKSLYTIPTWSRTAALVAEHAALRAALGGEAPSVYACYRFTAKLRQHKASLDACIAAVLASLHDEMPELGRDVAIDGSDLPAYANGQRFVYNHGPERKRFSDPDASWGHRSSISVRKGGGYYGYKVHAAVCATTGLPVAWQVETAKDAEAPVVPRLLDSLLGRGFGVDTCAMDRGYDVGPVYEACESRGIRPVVPLKETPFVKAGKHRPPTCEHGTWAFAGSDAKRGASKYRCPSGECSPASVWIKADRLHTLIPRETVRWKKLYRGRSGVEREFGRLKHEWAMLPLRVRRMERVRLHVDLTILSRLAVALAKARAVPLAA
ncbi:MAG: transposase [Actinomycetota bacterium]|nr:transposase [Actinomycetota bacterium]